MSKVHILTVDCVLFNVITMLIASYLPVTFNTHPAIESLYSLTTWRRRKNPCLLSPHAKYPRPVIARGVDAWSNKHNRHVAACFSYIPLVMRRTYLKWSTVLRTVFPSGMAIPLHFYDGVAKSIKRLWITNRNF